MSRGVLAVALASAVLVGCGGDDDGSSAPPVASTPPASTAHREAGHADRALALRGNPRLSDFPPGWQEVPNRSTNTNTCPDYLAARRAAVVRHVAPRFQKGNAAVDSSVFVFTSPAQAAASFARMSSAAFVECLRRQAEKTVTSDSRGNRVSGVETGRLSTRRFGQQTTAYEITGEVSTTAAEVNFYADIYLVRQGRALAFMRFIDVLSPLDEQLRIRLLTAVASRLRAG